MKPTTHTKEPIIDTQAETIAFEAHTRMICEKNGHDAEHELRKRPQGTYAEPRIFAAYEGWQARAAQANAVVDEKALVKAIYSVEWPLSEYGQLGLETHEARIRHCNKYLNAISPYLHPAPQTLDASARKDEASNATIASDAVAATGQPVQKPDIDMAISEPERLNYEIGFLDARQTPDERLIDARDKTKDLLDNLLCAPKRASVTPDAPVTEPANPLAFLDAPGTVEVVAKAICPFAYQAWDRSIAYQLAEGETAEKAIEFAYFFDRGMHESVQIENVRKQAQYAIATIKRIAEKE